MVTYQKYMFDNFIVSDNKAEACTDNNAEKIDNEMQEAINPEEYIDETVVETTEEYVGAFMLDDEHYFVSADPLKDGVIRAWDILDKTGFLGEDNKVDILDHINTDLYEEALAEATELYGDEAPEFYKAQKAFFEEHNK